jgi:hypothetical protein
LKPYGRTIGGDAGNQLNKQDSLYHTIRVDGHGSVTSKPDQAVISLGVMVEDRNAQDAQQQNAVISNQVLSALRQMGIQQEDIQTIRYTIDPVYDYNDGQTTLRGYRVLHMLQLTIEDISQVGVVIDVATQNGANEISRLEFNVSNYEAYYIEALKRATLNAKKKAEEIASLLGVSIQNLPLWISESGTTIEPGITREALTATATPIQEGELTINASVNAVFQY